MVLAVITQVLLRPRRIGTLLVLGGMIGVVVVGAEGWWIVLGIVLFQMTACALLMTWVDLAQIIRPGRRIRPRHTRPRHTRTRHTRRGLVPSRLASPCGAPVAIPRPRRPTADECGAGE